jgi:hypothetical protein
MSDWTSQRVVDGWEHESGLRPLGEFPDHCERCRLVATCEHEDITEMRTWAGDVYLSLCSRCGIDTAALYGEEVR